MASAISSGPACSPALARKDGRADRDAALAALFERGVAGVAEVDWETGRFLRVNPRYCEMLRRPEAELLRLGPGDLVLPEDRAAYESQRRAALSTCGVWQAELRHVLGDGERAWMKVGISICERDASGAPLRSVAVIQDINESVLASEKLRLSEEMLRLGQHVGRIATFVRDLRTGRVECNAESREIVGLPPGDGDLPVEVWSAAFLPEDRLRIAAIMADAVARKQSEIAYDFATRRPGEIEARRFEMRAHYFYDEEGRPLRSVAVAIDVTDRVRDAENLRISEEMRRLGQQVGQIATFVRDHATRLLTLTAESRGILGLPPGEGPIRTSEWVALVVPEDRERLLTAIDRALKRREPYTSLEYRIRRPSDAAQRYMDMRGRHFYDASGRPLRSIGVAIDVTERRLAEERLAHAATHDALTGLPNRTLLRDRVEAALARRRRGENFAMLCLDLDRFKEVNDALGHAVGDRLLVEVSRRILAILRETDTLARLGGDEFAILQTEVEGAKDAAALAERILAQVSAPFVFDGEPVIVGVSVGIALAPAAGTQYDDLLRAADMALYHAKSEGRGRNAFFAAEMDARMQTRRALQMDLREALERREFEMHYQPIVEVASRRVVGFEALIRWRRPDGRLAPPDMFIPLCEETGLIVPLGALALEIACREAASWGDDLSVAVNLSPLQFANGRVEADVAAALAAAGLPPSRLELEITESAVLNDTEATLAALSRLKARGVRIAMDDFGAGYSSLNHLQRFPFDRVKIDRSFTQKIVSSRKSHAIVKAIADLCRALQMSTTAEGVETEEQMRAVARIGCCEAQGYLFSRPRQAAEIPTILAELRSAGRARAAAE